MRAGGVGVARGAVVVSIMLVIAAAHVVGIGRRLQPQWAALYSSYFSDLVLPFGYYFLLFLPEERWDFLGRSEGKATAVFLMASAAETLQYFGVWALGSTFDPIDYAMYAVGVIAAAFVDTQLFARAFAFWREGTASQSSGPAPG
jgi:hypothetical protein